MLLQIIFSITLAINPEIAVFSVFLVMPVVMLLVMGVLFGWWWAAGTSLHQKLPEGVSMQLGRFKFFLLFPVFYITCFLLLLALAFSSFITIIDNIIFPLLLFPLHLFAMFCLFYCIYFIAKALKSIELGREAIVSEYLGEFLMLWFYPIGIWIIQPKLNALFTTNAPDILDDLL